MTYRDDDISQLRTEINNLITRVDELEGFLKEGNTKPRQSFLNAVLSGITRFFGWIWYNIICSHFFVFLAVISLMVVVSYGLSKLADQKIEEDLLEQNQALSRQCESFCESHGYAFHNVENRMGPLCFCSLQNSQEPVFVINVETSEHWNLRINEQVE